MQLSKWVTLAFGAFCLTAVSGVLGTQHLYYMAAILLTLPGISWLLGVFAVRGVAFSRILPPIAWESEVGQIHYLAQNSSKLPRFFFGVYEPFPDWITSLEKEPPLFNIAPNNTTEVAHDVLFHKRGVYQVDHFNVVANDCASKSKTTKRFC